MLNIINDLIDISKVEAGQMEINISEININELIKYLYTFFEPEAERKGLNFSIIKHTVDETLIYSDKEKVYAILSNLIKNAIKYSKTGNIEFGYKLKNDGVTDEIGILCQGHRDWDSQKSPACNFRSLCTSRY